MTGNHLNNLSVIKSEVYKDVLYQKIGEQWYVFVEGDGTENQELLYAPLPKGINPLQDELLLHEFLEEQLQKKSSTKDPVSPNSPSSPRRRVDKSL